MVKGQHIIRMGLICVMLSACNGNTYYSSVPSLPVQFVYNVLAEDPSFVTANTSAYKIIKERRYETDYIGFAGLLLFVGMDMNYHAFDLACPHCLSVKNTLEVDGIFAVCPICGEKYDLSYGYATPTVGITTEPLRKYRCNWNGTTLTVSN